MKSKETYHSSCIFCACIVSKIQLPSSSQNSAEGTVIRFRWAHHVCFSVPSLSIIMGYDLSL